MPRRRRKRTSGTKPPLEFKESPLHIVRTVPSPVFCADNPVTADVVPVEECGKIPWVSPQFQGSPTPYLRRSKRQRFPTGNGTVQSRRKSVVCQPAQAKSVKRLRKGIVPLQFVGDPSSTDPNGSFSENISINENDEVESEILVPKQNDMISSRDDKKTNGDNHFEDDINQFDEPVNDIPDGEAVPSVPDFDIETPPACPLTAILTPNLNVTPPSRTNNKSVDKQTTSSCDLTQKVPKCHKDKGKKKLMFESDSENNGCDLNDGKAVSFGFAVDDMPLDNDPAKCDKDEFNASPKESRVKKLRTIFSGVLDYTPERPERSSNSTILAYDTPVEDQGLTERQKILKKYKKRKKNL